MLSLTKLADTHDDDDDDADRAVRAACDDARVRDLLLVAAVYIAAAIDFDVGRDILRHLDISFSCRVAKNNLRSVRLLCVAIGCQHTKFTTRTDHATRRSTQRRAVARSLRSQRASVPQSAACTTGNGGNEVDGKADEKLGVSCDVVSICRVIIRTVVLLFDCNEQKSTNGAPFWELVIAQGKTILDRITIVVIR